MDQCIGKDVVCDAANDYVFIVKVVDLVMHPTLWGELKPHFQYDDGRHDRHFVPCSMMSPKKTETWQKATQQEKAKLLRAWKVLRQSSHTSLQYLT